MGVYNKEKCKEMLLEYGYGSDNIQPLDESGLGNVGIVLAALGGATTLIGIPLYAAIHNKNIIKKALKYYVEDNPGCIPVSELDRKVYALKHRSYEPDPDKEMDEKKAKRAETLNLDRAVCYFEKTKFVMFYAYRSSYSHEEIKVNFLDYRFKQHKEYYFSYFLLERNMWNWNTVRWAKNVIKNHKDSKYKE